MGAFPLADEAFDGLRGGVAFIGQNDVARVGIDPRIGWNNEFKFAPERRGVTGPAGVNGVAVVVGIGWPGKKGGLDEKAAVLVKAVGEAIGRVDARAVEARDAEGKEDAARSAAVLPE